MRNYFLLVLGIFFFLDVFGQSDQVDMNMVQKIKDKEATDSYLPRIAHYLTDVSGPRLTNSPGYKRASQWAVQTLKSWGLQNAALEPWGDFGKGWSLEHCYVAMTSPYYKPFIGYARAWTPGTNGNISGQVVLLEHMDSATITKMAAEIKGKIVLVHTNDTLLRSPYNETHPRYEDSTLSKMKDMYMIPHGVLNGYFKYFVNQYKTSLYLKSVGAAAVLGFNGGSRDGTVVLDGTQAFRSDFQTSVPAVTIDKEDFLTLQRLLQDGTAVQLDMNVQVKWYTDDTKGYNVVAEIPGTDPELKKQVVMLGGHLDSWHPGTGATDNAAGCAVMMEAVRLLEALNVKPRRTIRIVLWSGEEQGLLGSFGYVKKHYGDPATMELSPEQKNVSVYFNLDNGSGKIRGIFLQNNEEARPIFTSWLAPFADMGATGVTYSNTGSTDHLSFDAVGIPAFQFIQDPLEYESRTHHSNADTYDHLQMKDLEQAAAIVTSFVYNAAMRNDMIPRKPLPKPERFVFDFDYLLKQALQ